MHVILSLWVVLYQHEIPASVDDARIVARIPEIGAVVVAADANFATRAAADPEIAFVGRDVEVPMIDTRAVPAEPGHSAIWRSEPMYHLQWDKQHIAASPQGSYVIQQGRPEVVVAILDTGVEASHPDIAPNLDASRSRAFYPVQDDPNGNRDPAAWDDRNGHGTWCASAVAAPINGTGISGVAPRVRTVALKVLGDQGTGSFVSLAQALVYSAYRFDIVSMSLIGYLQRDNPDHQALRELVQRAVTYARSGGVTPIAALGNAAMDISDPEFTSRYMPIPAELDGVIGVSATNRNYAKASYSNYGRGITDLTAPGGDSTDPLLGAWAPDGIFQQADYAWVYGTSMACPNVAGVAALIVSQYGDFSPYRARGTHLPPDVVESYLLKSATPMGEEQWFGAGMADALAAVSYERAERTDELPSGQ